MKNNYLYSVTDKALFDALNQHKITNNHLSDMLLCRGVIVSKYTDKKTLAKSFCLYHHDYYDHQKIADVLGVAPRKEKTTSSFIKNEDDKDDIYDFWSAAESLKDGIISNNDQCNIYKKGDSIIIDITYSTLHYDKSDFNQVVKKTSQIEIIKGNDCYTIRRPDNEQFENYMEILLSNLKDDNNIDKTEINLFNVPDPELRSKFFDKFIKSIPNFNLRDVSDVFVYNPNTIFNDGDEIDSSEYPEIRKVSLKGKSVLDSTELKSFFENGFYIWKIRWTLEEDLPDPDIYEFEAQFSNMIDFTEFSYISKGYWKYKGQQQYNKTKSQLDSTKNSFFLSLFEKSALKSMNDIKEMYQGVEENELS